MTNIKLPSIYKMLAFVLINISLAIIAYYYIDRPVAVWAYNNSKIHPLHMFWEYPTHIQPLFYFLSPWIMFYLIRRAIKYPRQLNDNDTMLFLMVIALWLSLLLSEELRILFGRSWTSTWFHGNLSYIQHGVYGFTWLQTAHEYKSFPSGHTTLTFAFMMSLWWQTRNTWLRLFAIFSCIVVPLGLILMCYHWVSDVIIGVLVGSVSAYIVLYAYQNIQRTQ